MFAHTETRKLGTLSVKDLAIGLREEGEVTILDMKGRLVCGPSHECFDNLVELLSEQHRGVILNFQHLDYLDSRGIGSVVDAAVKMQGRIVIVGVSARIDSMLTICKLATVLPMFTSEGEAIRSLRS
jgi:anti-anti-sigma factor